MRGVVTNIQRFSIHDGPGIRTTVFLKGCPLRCVWCHNPENLDAAPQLAYTPPRCLACGACAAACPQGAHELGEGRHLLHRARCRVCGACVDACPAAALEMMGRVMAAAEVLAVVERDRPFYETSGGGVTLSGGEPLAQVEFTHALLEGAKTIGLHTALDTCGHAAWSAFETLLPLVDLWLYDLKHAHPERHRELTGATNEQLLANLRRLLGEGADVVVRVPVVPGRNDGEAEMAAMLELLSALVPSDIRLEVDLMPYHRLAEAKYARLGMLYACQGTEPPTRERMAEIAARFEAAGVKVRVGGA